MSMCPWLNWIERCAPKAEVRGPNPLGRAHFGTKLGTPIPADFPPDAATSLRGRAFLWGLTADVPFVDLNPPVTAIGVAPPLLHTLRIAQIDLRMR